MMVLDLLITCVFDPVSAEAIALSIIVLGWVDYSVRQWMWRRLFWHGEAP